MSTHNLCFRAKIRKIGYPCIPQFCFILGFKGIFIARTCYPDGHYYSIFITVHYENLPMQYTEIFLALKIENF